MEFTRLTVTQRKAMLEQRLTQYEAEFYGHELNKAALVATGDTSTGTTDEIGRCDEAMGIIDAAHGSALDELQALDTAEAAAPQEGDDAPAS
jgi:hypothetical protein